MLSTKRSWSLRNMKKMLTGNSSAAWGARVSDADYVCAYPITPQTEIVETLSSWVKEGALKARFVNFDSEHSMFAAAGAASLTGARVFTCTSSQGLIYGLEMLYSIAGWRAPLVLVNVSRGLGMPMILQVEHGDVLATRDSGFVQLHAENCQEVLDLIMLGYRIGEDGRVMLPVVVNMDGFVLSFARQAVDIPKRESVEKFLPRYSHPRPLLGLESAPVSYGPTTSDGFVYSFYKYQLHEASLESRKVFQAAAQEFFDLFGRRHEPVETVMTEDADYVFVVTNSYSSNVRAGVQSLRRQGEKVGMVKLKMLRPFPREELANALSSAKAVAVYEQNLAPGRGAIIFPEIAEALYHSKDRPEVLLSFVGGLGGMSLGMPEMQYMLKNCKECLKTGQSSEQPLLLYRNEDWEKMKSSLSKAGLPISTGAELAE